MLEYEVIGGGFINRSMIQTYIIRTYSTALQTSDHRIRTYALIINQPQFSFIFSLPCTYMRSLCVMQILLSRNINDLFDHLISLLNILKARSCF